jgi:hypothetical protein
MRLWIAVLLSWLLLATPAFAENRLALVIGNNGYQHIDALQKARADAKSYADLLREKGYSVSEGYDLGSLEMQRAVAQFVEKIQPGDTTVFAYSGHGWSDGSTNYVVGVDAPDSAGQEWLTRVSLPIRNGLTGVLDDFARKGAGLKVAIIDACRDNPFHPPPNQKGYVLARGLKPQSIEGSFVIYSAGDGQTAMDRLSDLDTDPNSVFTRTLLPLLRADLPLTDAIKTSQQRTHALAASADHNQTPAYYDEVLGTACLSGQCKTNATSEPPSAPSASDQIMAAMIDTATSADFLATLIAALPEGPLKGRAKARAESLKKTHVANLTAEPPKAEEQDFSGSWVDSQLKISKIQIAQNGSDFSFRGSAVAEDGQLAGVGFDNFGRGTITGNSLDLTYSARFHNGVSATGHCSGVSRRDGLIAWRCKNSNSRAFFTPTWIRK